MLIVLSASLCALIVMKAKPLDSPVLRSLIILTDVTSPAIANNVLNSPAVVDLFKFLTHSLTFMFTTFSGVTDKNQPPPHNRDGGQSITQFQLFFLNCLI